MRVCLVMKLPCAHSLNQLRFPIVCFGLNDMQRLHLTYRVNAQVSGGLFRHEDVSKLRTAEALISGISAAFDDLRDKEKTDQSSSSGGGELLPHVNFAFDEDVFGLAYARMQKAMRKRTGSKDAQSESRGGCEQDRETSVAAHAGPDNSVPEQAEKDGADSKAATVEPAA